MPKELISAEDARQLVSYDPETGAISWRVKVASHTKVGAAVSTQRYDGYRLIRIRNVLYRQHRLAWLLTYGRWPEGDIDHINGDRSDNRLCNLREATRSQNLMNTVRRKNKTGFKGVSYHSLSGRYSAAVYVNKKKVSLGYYRTAEEAYEAYCVAAEKHYKDFANTG